MRIWVIDTGSIIEIRRGVPRGLRPKIIAELDSRARTGHIIYPPEVIGELERAAEEIRSKGHPDLPLTWAKKHEENGTRYGHLLDGAKAVLARIPNLIDPDRSASTAPTTPIRTSSPSRSMCKPKGTR